jgi:protocatechuate 3,4-dioxygenase beta subunit
MNEEGRYYFESIVPGNVPAVLAAYPSSAYSHHREPFASTDTAMPNPAGRDIAAHSM